MRGFNRERTCVVSGSVQDIVCMYACLVRVQGHDEESVTKDRSMEHDALKRACMYYSCSRPHVLEQQRTLLS